MPKSTNPTIGTCPCPICGSPAEVRKYKQTRRLDPAPGDGPQRWTGKLYLYCPDSCKTVKFENQNWILENATITGDVPAAPVVDELHAPSGDDPIPAPPEPEPAPEPPKKKPSRLKKFSDEWLL